MALSYDHGAIQWLTTDALNADLTVSGLSFQPKAIRFYCVGIQSATDAASEAVNGARSVGFTDGTNQRAVATHSQDGAGNMDCSSGLQTTCVVWAINAPAAADGRLGLASINSDGFTLNVDAVTPFNLTVFWEAWGGADITNVTVGTVTAPTADGDTTHTATGFTSTDDDSQAVMLAHCQSTGATFNLDAGLSIGFATGTGAGEQVVVVGNQDDGSAQGDTDGYCQSGTCVALVVEAGGTTLRTEAALSAFSTDQFTLTWDTRVASAPQGAYMAIKGGSWKAGETTIAGNTGSATTTVSGLSFAPVGISLIGRMTAESTADTPDQEDRIGIGSGSSTTSRRSLGYWDEHGTGTTEINTVVEYDSVLAYPSSAGALVSAYDINAMNSDGFQLIVDTAGGVASEWIGYLAFGSADTGSGAISVTAESSNTLAGASTAESPITSTGEAVATLTGAAIAEAPISATAESVNTLAGASVAEAPIASTAEAIATLDGASIAEAPITSTGEALATLDGAAIADFVISMTGESVATLEGQSLGGIQSGEWSAVGESIATLDGASTAEAPLTASGESVATLEGAATAEAPITAAGEAVATLEGASTAEAPITSVAEAIATLVGESTADGAITSTAESVTTLEGASTAEAPITSAGEAVATLEGVEVVQGSDIFMAGESTVDFSASSLADGAIVSAGEATVIMVGSDAAEAAYRPSWYHGTSKAKLKNPWGKKKRKKFECEFDDEEVYELARIAVLALHSNRRAAGISIRTSSSSRVGVPACPEVMR